MYVTFMMGNGLDVSLGLATRYKDFYPYFIKNASPDNYIRRELEKASGKQFETWSDLEIKLGEITAEIDGEDENQVNHFLEDMLEMVDYLTDYLTEEQNKFNADETVLKKKIMNAIRQVRVNNIENERELIKRIYAAHAEEEHYYCAITFNYTNCLDRMWDAVGDAIIENRVIRGVKYIDKLGQLLHIHGSIEEKALLLGVNDYTQILNETMREEPRVKRTMIKPWLNEEYGQNKIKKAKKLMDASSIICLYGLSIGDTDRMWWEYLGEWLLKGTNRILIIYNYEPGVPERNLVRTLNSKEKVKMNFLNQTGIEEDKKAEVMQRIIVRNNVGIVD